MNEGKRSLHVNLARDDRSEPEQANGFAARRRASDDRANCTQRGKSGAGERVLSNEFRVRTLTDNTALFKVPSPVPSSDGSIREWIGANTDVTERKRIEQALRRAKSASGSSLGHSRWNP
jgi:PAS domain-containing protein